MGGAVRMPLLLGLSTALLASCAIGAPRWTTPGAHVVDGYWLGEETPCPSAGRDPKACLHAVPLVVEALLLEEPDAVVVGTWTAQRTEYWLDAEGQQQFIMSTRVGGELAVVLELADGRRRVFGAMCPMTSAAVGAPLCYLSPVVAFRVGEEPWK